VTNSGACHYVTTPSPRKKQRLRRYLFYSPQAACKQACAACEKSNGLAALGRLIHYNGPFTTQNAAAPPLSLLFTAGRLQAGLRGLR